MLNGLNESYQRMDRGPSNPQSFKTKALNQCVLPVMTHGAETWILIASTVDGCWRHTIGRAGVIKGSLMSSSECVYKLTDKVKWCKIVISFYMANELHYPLKF